VGTNAECRGTSGESSEKWERWVSGFGGPGDRFEVSDFELRILNFLFPMDQKAR
jgi:uncharacterized protein with beta-barrel porin domain